MIEIKNNINKGKDFEKEGLNLKKLYKIYSCLDSESYKIVNDDLISKGISWDMVKETDNKYLISFSLDRKPDTSILTCSKNEWIVDEYKEIELYDGTGSGEFKFERAIFYKCNHKNIPFSQSFDNFNSLLKLYPVHYGKIRIKELNSQIEGLRERIDKLENNISQTNWKQFWVTELEILKNKLKLNLDEISFIENLWETLNKELYGYDDDNFALRYRGIDPFSPLSFLTL